MSQQSMFAESYPHTPSDYEIMTALAEQAYAPMPISLGRAACIELFDDFRTFVDLCDDSIDGSKLVEAVTFKVNDRGNGAFFLNYRRPGEKNPHEIDRAPGKDHKYIFHHGVQTTERATSTLGGALPAEMKTFLAKCDEAYDAGRQTIKIAAKVLGLEGVLFSGFRGDDVHHLRLIDYIASDDSLLGEAHFDRSWATVAFFESDSGLRGVPGQNGYLEPVSEQYIEGLRENLQPISHYEYESKLFLGAGANRLPAANRVKTAHLPLLGHDITNDRPGESRQAAVIFANPHDRFRGYSVPTKYETGFDDIIVNIRKREAAA